MQFTQFYASPLYLNPAFTGITMEHRFSGIYRNQWVGIPGHFVNSAFSYDYNLAELNSGIGLLFAQESAGTAKLRNTEVGLLYAYHIMLDRKWYLQPGLKFNYVFRSINFNELVFNDQLYRGGGSSTETILDNRINYLDISSGILLYSEKIWFGISYNHMNAPNQSLNGNESILPPKFSTHGGIKFDIKDDGNKKTVRKAVSVTFNYKSQAKFDQLDLGLYYDHNPLVLGLWYRGIPLLKAYEPGYANNDALAAIVGYKVDEYNLKIGYSYDLTISRLFANTAGAHELSVVYEVAGKKKKRRRKFLVPCAKF
jgi:type IX secretion system PorP/SprF family membrane protein